MGHRTFTTVFALSLSLVSFQQVAGGAQFSPAVNYPVGQNPFGVAVGDFNGDGIPDLAVANAAQGLPSGTISILIGKGDGTFKAAVNYNAGGPEPSSVATADFNGDGKLDLVVANYAGGGGTPNLSVLLGNGDGTFKAAVNYTAGTRPFAVVVADFNGDGRLDLAAGNDLGGVSVLLGNGDGTFKAAVNYSTGIASSSVVVGDFNHDGKLDLAVANTNSDDVSILLGKGDGTFQAAVNYPAGSGPESVASGDFNADGKLDLVVANAGGSFGTTVNVLLGNGDGTFQAPVSYPAGAEPFSVAVGDFNKDGKLDLAVTDAGVGSGDAISLLLGNGDGTFQAAVEFTVGTAPVFVVAADLRHNGLLDLVVANDNSNNISVLLNASPAPCTIRPDITDLLADPDRIWPPDHRFVKVSVRYKATSRCGGSPVCTLKVKSNQRDDQKDWSIIDAHHVELRAEESAPRCIEDPRHSLVDSHADELCHGPTEDRNRVYTIVVKCTDASGNSAKDRTTVTVAPGWHKE